MELVREHTVHSFGWCWSEQAVCAVHVVSVPRCVIHSPLRAPTRKYAHTNRIAWAQHAGPDGRVLGMVRTPPNATLSAIDTGPRVRAERARSRRKREAARPEARKLTHPKLAVRRSRAMPMKRLTTAVASGTIPNRAVRRAQHCLVRKPTLTRNSRGTVYAYTSSLQLGLDK